MSNLRFSFRQGIDEDIQQDLNVVQEVLNSAYFMVVDLFFWAFLLTSLTTPAHHSLRMMVIVYISYYLSGISLFFIITRWFKTDKSLSNN